MENNYTKAQLVELVETRTKVKCGEDWILNEGFSNGFIKGKSKVGVTPVFHVDESLFDKWISDYSIPSNYISLRNAKECGISYMTARNAYACGELEVKTLGFGKERMQYADRDELKRVGAKHPKCNI